MQAVEQCSMETIGTLTTQSIWHGLRGGNKYKYIISTICR